jgi:GMP synthase (glutamine-hydrolysing)
MSGTCTALFHESFEDLGSFASVLKDREWEFRLRDAKIAGSVASVGEEGPDLLVILGGPMGVYESARYPFLQEEIELASRRLRQDLPTLGICLGSQIMAAALGATVQRGPVQEIGWYPIELECEAESDPVACRIISEDATVLHWHGDTFDLPSGTVPLARSHLYERQGFRKGRFGYALQFHLEVLPERIGEWTRAHATQLASTPRAQTAAQIEAGARRHGPSMARQARSFLNAYLDLVETRGSEKS